jgi:hypothetical protein
MVRTGKPLRMDRRPGMAPIYAEAKQEVATHRFKCCCHVAAIRCCGAQFKRAKDSGSQEWHIDPWCKVRPEAKA